MQMGRHRIGDITGEDQLSWRNCIEKNPQSTLDIKFNDRNLRSRTRSQLRGLKSLGSRILYGETDSPSSGDLALEDALGSRKAYDIICAGIST
jgi:hypothetical protein